MHTHNPHKVGLALGIFMASMHAIWSLLVLAGVAQWLLDTIFWLHMLTPAHQVSGFNVGQALGLIAVTGTIGYLAGLFLGFVWNRFAAK